MSNYFSESCHEYFVKDTVLRTLTVCAIIIDVSLLTIAAGLAVSVCPTMSALFCCCVENALKTKANGEADHT